MSKYHINPKTGNPGLCRAKTRCPFGSLEKEHYDSKDEAREAYEKANSKSFKNSEQIRLEEKYRAFLIPQGAIRRGFSSNSENKEKIEEEGEALNSKLEEHYPDFHQALKNYSMVGYELTNSYLRDKDTFIQNVRERVRKKSVNTPDQNLRTDVLAFFEESERKIFERTSKSVKELDEAFLLFSDQDTVHTSWRSVGLTPEVEEELSQLKPGVIYSSKSYLSTTADADYVYDFNSPLNDDEPKKVIFEIVGRGSINMARRASKNNIFNLQHDEKELLYDRDKKFVVISISDELFESNKPTRDQKYAGIKGTKRQKKLKTIRIVDLTL